MWCPTPQTGVQLQAITSAPAEPHQYLPRSRAETGYVGLTPTKNTAVKPSPRQEQVALPYRVRRGLGSGEVRVQCARGTPHVDSDTRHQPVQSRGAKALVLSWIWRGGRDASHRVVCYCHCGSSDTCRNRRHCCRCSHLCFFVT